MRTWKIEEVKETLEQLNDDVSDKAPLYIQIRLTEDESVIYPISSIGSNGKCILISAYDRDMKPFEAVKELNPNAWVERIRFKK